MPHSDAFHRSFHRCLDRPGFFDHFYDTFLQSPEVAAFFEDTDMERQKKHLKMSLYVIAAHLPELETFTTADYFHRLCQRHRALGICPEHYDLWLDALVETAYAFDPQFGDPLEATWRRVMGQVVELMLSEESAGRDSSAG